MRHKSHDFENAKHCILKLRLAWRMSPWRKPGASAIKPERARLVLEFLASGFLALMPSLSPVPRSLRSLVEMREEFPVFYR